MTIKISVPIPFINSTMAALIPKSHGTNTEALNMANVC